MSGLTRRSSGSRKSLLALAVLSTVGVLGIIQPAQATYIWDADTGTTDVQDGAGIWTSASTNFWDTVGVADVAYSSITPAVVQIGSGSAGATAYGIGLGGNNIAVAGLVVSNGGTYTINTTSPGDTFSIGANGIAMDSTAQTFTISRVVTLTAAQAWTNNASNQMIISGKITGGFALNLNGGATSVYSFSSTANDYSGGITLTSGILDTGSNNFTFGTGTITFNGGTERSSGAGNRTITNAMIIDTNGGTFTGTQGDSYNGNTTVQNSPTVNFTGSGALTFGGAWTLNSDLTIDGSGSGTSSWTGGLTVGGAVASTNRTITSTRGGNSVQFGGTLSGTAAGQTITLAGTGTNNQINNLTSGTNAPDIIINADAAAVYKFNITTSTYTGKITLTSGIADLQQNTNPDFSAATVVLNGGTIRNSTGTRNINGTSTLVFDTGGGTFTNSALAQDTNFLSTIAITVQNTPTINFTNSSLGQFSFAGAVALNSDWVIAGTHTGAATFSGGASLAGATRTITANDTGTLTLPGVTGTAGTLILKGSNSAVTIGASTASATTIQVDTTAGGTFKFNDGSTYAGGTTLTNGKIRAAGNASFGTGTLTLSGGTLTSSAGGSGGDRTFANVTTINGTVAFGDAVNTGYLLTFTGGTTFDSSAIISNTNNNGVVFSTNSTILNTGFTVNAGVTPSAFTFSSGFTVPGAVANANRTVTLNNGSTSVAISGALTGTAAGQTITLAGSGTNNNIGLITSGANTPGLIVNGDATSLFKFGSASTFSGGVTLTSGIAEVSVDTVGAVTSGPMGTGTITLNGGTLRPGTNADRTLSNVIAITGGSSTFASSTSSGRALTLTGNVTISGTPTVTFSNTNNTAFTTGTTTLNSDATFAGSGNYSFRNGLTFGAPRQLTLNSTGAAVFRGALTGGSNTLTLAGNGTNVSFGDGTAPAVTGSTGGIIIDGPAVAFATSTSTFTGGVTATSGILRIGGDSTVTASAVANGPLGLGTLTAGGGTITANSGTTRTINNNLAITGNSTFGVIGDATNTGTLTFNPTGVTGGTITLTGARTLTVNVGTTLTGPITGSGGASLTVKGLAALSLSNSVSNSSMGNVTIGDATASGSIGGRVNASSQNALGSGTYTINYGGMLNPNANYSPSNAVTVNNGGTYAATGASGAITAFGASSSIASGGTLQNSSGQTLTITAANVSLPAAGVFFRTGADAVSVTGAYPTPTGTLAFGGTAGSTTTSSVATTISSDTTLAFNNVGAGSMQFNGIALSANLNVTGGSISTLTGIIPINSGTLSTSVSNLGAITQPSGSGSLTVNMTPTGSVAIGNGAVSATYTGGTTVNSGYLTFVAYNNNGTAAAKYAGGASSTGITLNGGWVRVTGNNGSGTSQDAIAVGPNGGGLEAFTINGTGNGSTVTFSGNITKSGGGNSLTLRYGGKDSSNFEQLVISGTNSAFDTGYALATSNGYGRVQFTGVASLGSDGTGTGSNTATKNVITAPSGVAFGFDAAGNGATTATLKTAMSYFSTSSGSILVLDNMTGINVNLSSSGTDFLNKDIRLGSAASIIYTGTITPNGSSYNFTPTSTSTLTLQNTGTSQVTGTGKALDVSAGTQTAGAYDAATGVLQFAAPQDFTGATTVEGVLRNSLTSGSAVGTNLTLGINSSTSSGDLSATSGVTVDYVSALKLIGKNGSQYGRIASPSVPITIKGGSTLTVGDSTANNTSITDRIVSSAALTLGGTSGAGTLTIQAGGAVGATAYNQTLASLTIGAGSNTVQSTGAGASNAANLTFTSAAPARATVGGALTYTTATNFVTKFTNGGSPSATNLIGGWAFYGTTGFAALDSTGTVIASTPSTNNINTASGDFQNTNSGTYALSAGQTVSSININSGTNNISTGTFGLIVSSGGIMSNQTLSINTGTGGTLSSSYVPTSGVREMIFNSTNNTLTVNPQIVQNSSINITVTKVGAGTVTLTNTTNQIGNVYVVGGTLNISNAVTSIGSGGVINLLGGTFGVGSGSIPTATFSNAYSIVVGASAGTLQTTGASTLNFNGDITLSGRLIVNSLDSGGAFTRINLGGTLSGAGALLVQGSRGNGGSTVATISGSNTNWSGGLRLDKDLGGSESMMARLDNSNAAGTGPIVGAAQTALYFTNNAANANLTNPVSGVPVLVNWATSNPVTLSGSTYSASGLNVQGYASGGVASELVLAGTTSYSGVPLVFNWSSVTPASTVQSFVNGQGGITVGSTGFSGTTALTGTSASALNNLSIDAPAGAPSTKLTQGALGFLRFSGASSFIPGAVGPGYLAAIHQANDATNYGNGTVSGTAGGANGLFGFLLTATNSPTYVLPEGKSFVIGSLGASVAVGSGQVGGTLGAAGTGTATLDGGNKAAVGSLLAGFGGGDVNIHANAAGDSQSLTLLARDGGTTLVLGSTGAKAVVFSPTYGDSGFSSALTLMAARTGTTAINKTGAGTVEFKNVQFNLPGNTTVNAAKSSFTVNVNEGTLAYSNVDAGTAAFSAVNVNGTAALNVTGSLITSVVNVSTTGTFSIASGGKVTVNESAGTLASGWPGGSGAAVSVVGNLTLTGTAKLDLYNNDLVIDYSGAVGTLFTDINDAVRTGYAGGAWNGNGINSTTAGQLNYFTLLVLDTADTNDNYQPGSGGPTVDATSVVVKFTHQDDLDGNGVVNATDKAIFTSHWSDGGTGATHRFGDMDFDGVYTFNDVQLFNLYYNTALPSLPEPGSLALLALGAAGLLARKRR